MSLLNWFLEIVVIFYVTADRAIEIEIMVRVWPKVDSVPTTKVCPARTLIDAL